MFRKILFLFAAASLITACNNTQQQTTETENAEAETTETAAVESNGKHFGELIDAEGAVPLAAVLEQMNESDSVAVKVMGTVDNVCQTKGCWMNVAEGEGSIFVQFKDYGFFMPMDCAGKKVAMDGYAYREVTSVEDLRHFAEDEGKSQEEIEAITEPVEELKFLASGVVFLDD